MRITQRSTTAQGTGRRSERETAGHRERTGAVLLATALLAGALLAVPDDAAAARFGVRVVDTAGEPIAGAAVCLGLEGSHDRYGAVLTDLDGQTALVEVPDVPLVVTVSKARFATTRRTEPVRRFDLVREIPLEGGSPGPRCRADDAVAADPPRIRVRDIGIRAGAAATVLTPSVTGDPSHYRIARDESFDGAPWQRFEPAITLPVALAAAPSVYLQLRRREGGPTAWVEAESDIVAVRLPRP